jgi:hypothetical protein
MDSSSKSPLILRLRKVCRNHRIAPKKAEMKDAGKMLTNN